METYLTRITDYLLTQSWQIALLVVIIAAVSLVLRNKSAHVRYLLWLIVLAKCLVPPLLTVPLAILPQEKPAIVLEATGTTIYEPLELPSEPVKLTRAPIVRERPAKLTIRQWLGAVWIVGAITFLVFNLLKAVRTNYWLWRKRRALSAELRSEIENLFSAHGIKSFPDVWQIDGISQPFVWGLLRGSIYLPADLLSVKNPKRCRNLLGHELSHVIRFDAAVNFLQVIAQAIFWFHPFVWWANRKIRAEREKSCDEMAIARLNASPRDYSTAIVETLVAKCESTRPVPSLAVAGPVKNIEERIKTMMKPGKKFYKRPSLIAATVVLLLALLTVPTALVLTARAGTKAEAQPLHRAAADGNINEVRSLISKGADVNAKDKEDFTPLHHAALHGPKDVAELLIEKGANVNALEGESRFTPLLCAAAQGQREDVAKVLIANGADVNAKDKWGYTPLIHAIFNEDMNMVELFISNGAKFDAKDQEGWTAFRHAASQGSRNLIELFAARGADVSSFHLAASTGDLARVERFLERGTYIDAGDDFEWTPLYWAACIGQTEVAEFLVSEGADINMKAKDGRTPLHQAAQAGAGKLVKLLVSKGADISAKDERGDTPIHSAASADVVEVLITKGANVNARTKVGRTPLHYAAWHDHTDVAESLINKGADFNAMDSRRMTALHYAAMYGHPEVVELLLVKSANVNARDKYGRTALHWSAMCGHKDIAELLVNREADVNAKTKEGKTPLSLAKEKGHQEIVELLLKHGAKE